MYILAHDIGTSAVKSSIVGSSGTLDSESLPHRTYYSEGISEQDPLDWWKGVVENTKALFERRPEARALIAGIGVGGHMLGGLPVDRIGNPLRRCMLHSDTRANAEAREIGDCIGAQRVYEITGNLVDARSPLCKMLWIKVNEADTYEKTYKFLQSKDFIVGKLTGNYCSTDYSDASHAQWLDVRRKDYAREIFAELGLSTAKLPELRKSIEIAGTLSRDAARQLGLPQGVPVAAGAGDGMCATVGAGAVSAGKTYCCIGTTAWISSLNDEPFIDAASRVFNILGADGEKCGVFGTTQNAGRAIDWVLNLFGEKGYRSFEEILSSVAPGCDGLLFLPYLEGERSPIWDNFARGVFFGASPSHGRTHFIRAAVEGVSYALRSILEVLRETAAIREVRLIGGGGQSDIWQQLLSDVCDVRIQLLSTNAADATSLGAAIIAGTAVGMHDTLAHGCTSIRIEREKAPQPACVEAYAKGAVKFSALYRSVAGLFRTES